LVIYSFLKKNLTAYGGREKEKEKKGKSIKGY
jgi:hypothetical protein